MIYDLLYEIVIYDRLPDLSHVIVSILLSLSLFFHPFFVSLVSLRFFEIVRNSSFRNSREKVGGGSESVRYTIMWWKNGESWPKKV